MAQVSARKPKIRSGSRGVSPSSARRTRDALMKALAPGQKLKSIRERAGVSQDECARALGKATPSGYGRYENDATYNARGEPIPAPIIAGIAPVLVGKGHPPVTLEELLEISEARSIMSLVTSVAKDASRDRPEPQQTSVPVPQPSSVPVTHRFPSGGLPLPDNLVSTLNSALKDSIIRGLQMACDYAEEIAQSPTRTKAEQQGALLVCSMCRQRIEEIQRS